MSVHKTLHGMAKKGRLNDDGLMVVGEVGVEVVGPIQR
jgi:hypothetical protein